MRPRVRYFSRRLSTRSAELASFALKTRRPSRDRKYAKDERILTPKPTSVQYNDWRQVEVEPLETFAPTLPISVIISSYQTPAETLARTLAALEGQTYPRELFEVIIVDDGSEPPLECPPSTRLDVKVVRQERRRFGLARARNNGARAAAHDILLFLDSDMLTEAGWMMAHARWHHTISDALTTVAMAHVAIDGISAETIRQRPGSLAALFSDRPADPPLGAGFMAKTNDLTSRADNLFRGIAHGGFGIGKDFYWLVGGSDESFTRYGAEDTELAYRAYTHGGLLVPVRDAFIWHQGRWSEDRDAKERNIRLQRGKAAQLIAHPSYRGHSPGRIFTVPQYVVTIDGRHRRTDQIIRAVVSLLADRVHDLVVRIETDASGDDERLERLEEEFGPDPRVRVAPARSALDEFPVSPFYVALPAAAFAPGLVYRLRVRLQDAVIATSELPDGSAVSIARSWVLHRAHRTGKSPADFGETRTIPAAVLKLKVAGEVECAAAEEPVDYPTKRERLRDQMRDIRCSREAWSLCKRMIGVVRWRALNKWQAARWRLRRMIRNS